MAGHIQQYSNRAWSPVLPDYTPSNALITATCASQKSALVDTSQQVWKHQDTGRANGPPAAPTEAGLHKALRLLVRSPLLSLIMKEGTTTLSVD